MLWIREYLLGETTLNDGPHSDDRNPLAYAGDRQQIVGDEEDARAELDL